MSSPTGTLAREDHYRTSWLDELCKLVVVVGALLYIIQCAVVVDAPMVAAARLWPWNTMAMAMIVCVATLSALRHAATYVMNGIAILLVGLIVACTCLIGVTYVFGGDGRHNAIGERVLHLLDAAMRLMSFEISSTKA